MIFNLRAQLKRCLRAASGYLDLEMPDHALRELASVAAVADDEYEWHILKGEAYRAKKEHHRGLESFKAALELIPDDLDALLGMAWCFKRIGQVEESIRMMRQAYQTHPEVGIVLYNLACYYALANNKDQALSWLGRAMRMDQKYRTLAIEETDFDPIRNDADFQHLLQLSVRK